MYQFSYMYVKRSSRRTPLNIYRWRCRAILPHLLLKPISDVNFTSSDACAKFPDFSSMFRSSKMRLSLEKKKNNNNNNNNKRSRFNRVLCTIGARSLIIIIIKAASSDGRDLAPGTADRWLQNDREQ